MLAVLRRSAPRARGCSEVVATYPRTAAIPRTQAGHRATDLQGFRRATPGLRGAQIGMGLAFPTHARTFPPDVRSG
jgi:hypothetical protein